jgi:hypothetical protein
LSFTVAVAVADSFQAFIGDDEFVLAPANPSMGGGHEYGLSVDGLSVQ